MHSLWSSVIWMMKRECNWKFSLKKKFQGCKKYAVGYRGFTRVYGQLFIKKIWLNYCRTHQEVYAADTRVSSCVDNKTAFGIHHPIKKIPYYTKKERNCHWCRIFFTNYLKERNTKILQFFKMMQNGIVFGFNITLNYPTKVNPFTDLRCWQQRKHTNDGKRGQCSKGAPMTWSCLYFVLPEGLRRLTFYRIEILHRV